MNRNKVLFVSYYFPPSGGSGVLRIVRFVKNLRHHDKEPYVLTVDKRDLWKLGYGTIQRDDSYVDVESLTNIKHVRLFRPSLLIVNIFKHVRAIKPAMLSMLKRPARQNAGAITDEEDPNQQEYKNIRSNYSSDMNSFLKFIYELLLAIDQIFEWAPRAVWHGIRFVRSNKIGVVCSSSPPWAVHLVGCAIKSFCRTLWIMDLRDPLTGIETEEINTKAYPWIIRVFYKMMERSFMRKADVVLCNCSEVMRYYEDKYPDTRFEVVLNSFDPDDYMKLQSDNLPNRPFVIGHFGALYPTIRTPDAFLRALASVMKKDPSLRDSVRVHFYGAADYVSLRSFRELIVELGIASMVDCYDYIPHDVVLQKMASADLLLLLQPHYSTNYQIPAKLYEYVAVRRPILAIAPRDSATARLIEEYNLGLACNPDDSSAVESAISTAYKKEVPVPDERVVEQFSATHMAGKLVEVIDSL